MEQLKPCPFCGKSVAYAGTIADIELLDSDDENFDWASTHYCVVCCYNSGGCGSCGGIRKTVEEAIEAWNRRACEEE